MGDLYHTYVVVSVLYGHKFDMHIYVCTYIYAYFLLVIENPLQIFCEHYQLMGENMEPKLLVHKDNLQQLLLSDGELDCIQTAPIDFMKNLYIVEKVRHMETPHVFRFLDILQGTSGQQHISNTIYNGINDIRTYLMYIVVLLFCYIILLCMNYTHTHARAHRCMCARAAHAYAHAHTYAHAHAYVYAHAHIYTHVHTFTQHN